MADTVRTVGCYADVIAMRHPKGRRAPTVAAQVSPVPIINAGDGGHNHPHADAGGSAHHPPRKGTASTSWSSAAAGTFSSAARCTALINAMMRYKSIRFVLISLPEELRVPEYVRESMHKNGVSFVEVERLEDVIGTPRYSLHDPCAARALSLTRRTMCASRTAISLILKKMRLARRDLCVLHPLPRVNEISRAVDDDPRACYFRQVANGKYMREALLMKLLEVEA